MDAVGQSAKAAMRFWPKADMAQCAAQVRFRGKKGMAPTGL
jgi:hypothetical protein